MFENRVFKLNEKQENKKGKYVLYCMESSIREDFNLSLEFAIEKANKLNMPLLVAFFITDKYKYSNQRYYRFMIEGVLKVRKHIQERGAKFVILKRTYKEGCLELSQNASLVIVERNYLKTQRRWRRYIAEKSDLAVYEVEDNVVVPIELLTNKAIPYAYLYREKVEKLLDKFLKTIPKIDLKVNSEGLEIDGLEYQTPEEFLENLNIDKAVSTVEKYYTGGTDEAKKRLKLFIERKLHKYKEYRSDPTKDYASELSPYLHFGNISPIEIVLEILRYYPKEDENVKSFFNELIIWRELSRNFCWYNEFYNHYEGIPKWAKDTLKEHQKDSREYTYTLLEFEQAKTHDNYWNAAQKELLTTGKMHNYMRMYWAKKILEWTENPRDAFDVACYLNDKYELDGRDPNGYGGISWCFGTFDRPWQERKVFGKIRYMNDKGLERKFDIKQYVRKWV